MRTNFISKNTGSYELVVFFNGWGMDSRVFSHWPEPAFDLLLLEDYRSLAIDDTLHKNLEQYRSVIVLAWSMGVWAYSRTYRQLNLPVERAIAINGTPNPIHDEWGIPVSIYEATLNNMSPENRDRFFRRMFTTKSDYLQFKEIQPQKNISEQKDELASIMDEVLSSELNLSHPFHSCVISAKDLIIPSGHQKDFWRGRAEITQLEGGHYPFFQWKSWEDMIESIF